MDRLTHNMPFKLYFAALFSWVAVLWEWYIKTGHQYIIIVLTTLITLGSFVYTVLGIYKRIIDIKNKKK